MKKYIGIITIIGFILTYIGGIHLFSQDIPADIPIDSTKWIKDREEMDSIDAYMRHWYEVLDTNSDGEIDDINIIFE